MAQEFYSLEETAGKLGKSVDDVRNLAKNPPADLRVFRDGTSWKFRAQEVDELVRRRALSSDPDLGSGDSIHGDDGDILFSDELPVVIDEGGLSGLGMMFGSSRNLKAGDDPKSGIKINPPAPKSSPKLAPIPAPKSSPKLGAMAPKSPIVVTPPRTPAPPAGKGALDSGPSDADVQLAFDEDDIFAAPPGSLSSGASDSDVRLTMDEPPGLSGILRGDSGASKRPVAGPPSPLAFGASATPLGAAKPPSAKPPAAVKPPSSIRLGGAAANELGSDEDILVFDDSGVGLPGLESGVKLAGDSGLKLPKKPGSGIGLGLGSGFLGAKAPAVPSKANDLDTTAAFAAPPRKTPELEATMPIKLGSAATPLGASTPVGPATPALGARGPATPLGLATPVGHATSVGPATPAVGGKGPSTPLGLATPVGAKADSSQDFSFDDGETLKLADSDASSDFDISFDTAPPKKPDAKAGAKAAAAKAPLDDSGFETLSFDAADLKPAGKDGPASGINLRKPDDSGIRLDDNKSDSSSEFELTVDSMDSLPSFKDSDDDIAPQALKAGTKPAAADSSSEFELELGEEDSAEADSESGSEVVAIDESESEAEADEAASDYEEYDDDMAPAAAAGAAALGAGGMAIASEPAPWSPWLLLGLIPTTVALCMGGMVVMELMRNSFTFAETSLPTSGPLGELGNTLAGYIGLGGK